MGAVSSGNPFGAGGGEEEESKRTNIKFTSGESKIVEVSRESPFYTSDAQTGHGNKVDANIPKHQQILLNRFRDLLIQRGIKACIGLGRSFKVKLGMCFYLFLLEV